MLTERQMLREILHRQAVHGRLLLMLLNGERRIEMSQEDIDAAVATLGTVTADLLTMATTTGARVTDVDTEVQALQAQLAAGNTQPDTSALVAAVAALQSSHDVMLGAVNALQADPNVPTSNPTPSPAPVPDGTTEV